MHYTLHGGAIKEKLSRFSFLLIATAFSIVLSLGLFAPANAATTPFYQGFEADTDGWLELGGSTINRVASGENSIESYEGDYHATLGVGDTISGGEYDGNAFGPFSRWGGYETEFPEHGYTTQVAVYIDTSLADGETDNRFDFSSAINNPAGDHNRDFIFAVGTDPNIAGQWLVSASNNAPGWPGNPSRSPLTIASSGWYVFEHTFTNNGGVLEVTMSVKDASGNTLSDWVLSDPTDIIGDTVGGNRYGWFATNDFEGLAIDATSRTIMSPENPETKDECKKGGWEAFGFKNQGQCVRFVETNKDSRD